MLKPLLGSAAALCLLVDSTSAFVTTGPSAAIPRRTDTMYNSCAPQTQPTLKTTNINMMSVEHEARAVSRRGIVGAFVGGVFAVFPAAVTAKDGPMIPESEKIKPPANSCLQGVGGMCEELSEGNPLILKLQKSSAENRERYQKEELESYWNRNYKDFFDYSCNAKDTKCGFERTADGKWQVNEKNKDKGIRLKAFKDRGVDFAGAQAAKGSGIPSPFK